MATDTKNNIIANIKENEQKVYNAFGIIETCILHSSYDDFNYAIILAKKSLDNIIVEFEKLKNEG